MLLWITIKTLFTKFKSKLTRYKIAIGIELSIKLSLYSPGFPYWPAKGMAVTAGGLVDVRFFGAHDRSWVPIRECFLYSKRDPNLNNKNKKNEIQEAILVKYHFLCLLSSQCYFSGWDRSPLATVPRHSPPVLHPSCPTSTLFHAV